MRRHSIAAIPGDGIGRTMTAKRRSSCRKSGSRGEVEGEGDTPCCRMPPGAKGGSAK